MKRLLLIKEKQIPQGKEFVSFLFMGRCKSGLTEIFPSVCISAIWGQCSLWGVAGGCQIACIVLTGAFWAQKFTFRGPESWTAVTSLFIDIEKNTPFHNNKNFEMLLF